MTAAIQQPLFVAPADERLLDDAARTVLEAIDRQGPISMREAGAIVYTLRGYRSLLFIPRPWQSSAGRTVLRRLERAQLARRVRGNRWRRA